MGGYFVLSLDFEGMWGSIGSKDVAGFYKRTEKMDYLLNRLIDLIRKYHIHCTWGTVGALACHNPKEVLEKLDYEIMYSKWNLKISDYIKNTDVGAYYYPKFIKYISECADQEIASHTFTHAYYLEHIGAVAAEREMLMSKNVLENYADDVKTIIFPRNQINSEYMHLLSKTGFRICRTNPKRLLRGVMGLEKMRRVLEFVNSYITLSRETCFSLGDITESSNVINIPYSFFLRFYDKRFEILEPLKMNRIKNDMRRASRENKIFHIWFHPHNLGSNIEKNFEILEDMFKYYQILNRDSGLESKNMRELAEIYIKNNIKGACK